MRAQTRIAFEDDSCRLGCADRGCSQQCDRSYQRRRHCHSRHDGTTPGRCFASLRKRCISRGALALPHSCESLPRGSSVPVLNKCVRAVVTCVRMSAVLCQGSLSRWALWPSLHCSSPLQSVCSCSTTTPTRYCATSAPGLCHILRWDCYLATSWCSNHPFGSRASSSLFINYAGVGHASVQSGWEMVQAIQAGEVSAKDALAQPLEYLWSTPTKIPE